MLDFIMSLSLKSLLTIFLIYNIIRLALFIYKNFLRKRLNLKQRYGTNTWALITGATDGIGKAFCEELAREGFNIILVSRNVDKLKTVAAEIEVKHKVETSFIIFDFNEKFNYNDYLNAFTELKNKYNISLLVNNVGTSARGNFMDIDLANISNVLNCNILPLTYLTRVLGHDMRKSEHKCAIINLSSFMSTRPMPYTGLYSATKIYTSFLTEALAGEANNSNIDFLSLMPLYTDTPMIKNLKNTFGVISTKECVDGALNDLGYELHSFGHWYHKILAYLISFVPLSVVKFNLRRRVQTGVKTD
jgi:17beta-estradiol 17-dehydrogenase / very-long-chain 3-oxoacyl-CoA reductase